MEAVNPMYTVRPAVVPSGWNTSHRLMFRNTTGAVGLVEKLEV